MEHSDSFWGEEELVANYRELTHSQRRSINRQIARMLEQRQRFDWSRLAEEWPDIWQVVANDMDPFDFEDLVAIILARHGYEYAPNMRRTRDEGVDLYRTQDEHGILVECKLRSERDVGAGEVRSVVGACVQHEIDHAILVTNALFTPDAQSAVDKLAAQTGPHIELIDNRRLTDMLQSPECSELREFFARPNLQGLQDLLRQTKRGERYIQRRLEVFGSDQNG